MLYGTIITPQKTDVPRQSSASHNLLYNNNNYSFNAFYRPNININYGTTNLYTNRSQQKSTTTVPAQATARKNGKQKSNGKGNKNNQRTSTTPRPVYTTVMLNQYSTGGKSVKNKSKISQSASSQSFNRITSTMRPRTTTRAPNSKSQLNFGGNKNNNNLLPSPKDKLEAANSNIFEKSPGKAPKQVKETTPSVHATLPTRSPSMSRMFERYEKIEQIYPELKPYKDKNNPTYFTVTSGNGNGKPSRENSKSFSSFVSLNPAPQKKNSPSDMPSVARQQVISPSSNANDMNGKGTNQFIFLTNYTMCLVIFLMFRQRNVFIFPDKFYFFVLSVLPSGLLICIDEFIICGFLGVREKLMDRLIVQSIKVTSSKTFCSLSMNHVNLSHPLLPPSKS